MMHIFTIIFMDMNLIDSVTNIITTTKATGIAKLIGNKGGVIGAFQLFDTSYCFVNCHLAAKPYRV